MMSGRYAVWALVALLVACSHAQNTYLREHSLKQPYTDSNLENRYWEFGGHTVVSTNKYVRLTPDHQSKKGWLWSKMPMTSENWVVEFEFKVDGQGSRVYGDGFAFWAVTQPLKNPGNAFGVEGRFNGVGVFFDTYANTRHSYSFPYVGVMVNDGTIVYNNDDDGANQLLGGCESRFRRLPTPTRARISYIDRAFKVELDLKGDGNYALCHAEPDLNLPRNLYLGFTAATGDVADNHDIISVATYSVPQRGSAANNGPASSVPLEDAARITRNRPPRVGSTASSGVGGLSVMSWIFLVLFGMMAVGVIIVAAKYASTSHSKRF